MAEQTRPRDEEEFEAEGPSQEDLEELSAPETAELTCPKCGASVYEDADRCPSCGAYVVPAHGRTSRTAAWIMAVAVAVIVALLIWLLLRG